MNEWRSVDPIEDVPKMRCLLLFAITDTDTGNWKMATGCRSQGYRNEPDCWEWDGRRLRIYDHQPTHWMPLPDPPELPRG